MGDGRTDLTRRADAIVVATRNRAELLRASLPKLTATGCPVIVVDTASGDGTTDVLGDASPSLRFIRLCSILGCGARNVGVALARTPYVAFADDDSWWDGENLHAATAMLDRHAPSVSSPPACSSATKRVPTRSATCWRTARWAQGRTAGYRRRSPASSAA